MSARAWSDTERNIVREGIRDELSSREIHTALVTAGFKRSFKAVSLMATRLRSEPEVAAEPAAAVKETWAESDDAATATAVLPVRSLEALLERFEVDTDVWEVDRWVANKWDQGAKDNGGDLVSQELFQVKAWFKRRQRDSRVDAAKLVLADIAEYAPRLEPVKRPVLVGERHMQEIHLPDAHFGMYAWGPEAGEDWDTGMAQDAYMEAVQSHLDAYAHMPREEVVVVVGSDMLHVDSDANTTTKGTPQDVDTRRAKVIAATLRTVTAAVELCRLVAPVKIIGVPGNHDFESAQWLTMYLGAWFRDTKDVSVDDSPAPRKYHRYGRNLLGITHGNEEKASELPAIMAHEVPELWAATTYREWHMGHIHRKKQVEFLSVDERTAVVLRWLSTISPKSAWAHRRGYAAQRAAESFLWRQSGGMVGYHRHFPTPHTEG